MPDRSVRRSFALKAGHLKHDRLQALLLELRLILMRRFLRRFAFVSFLIPSVPPTPWAVTVSKPAPATMTTVSSTMPPKKHAWSKAHHATAQTSHSRVKAHLLETLLVTFYFEPVTVISLNQANFM